MNLDIQEKPSGLFGWFWSIIPSLSRPLPNPGKYDELDQEARSVLQIHEAFEGCKFDYQRPLSPFFLVQHSITLGAAHAPEGTYEFGSNYAWSSGALFGRVDTSGNVVARAQLVPSAQSLILAQAQISNAPHHSNALVEGTYRGSDWYGVAAVGANGRYVANYFQSITSHLAMGGGLEIQTRIPNHPGGGSSLSGGFRYNAADWALSGQIASIGRMNVSYVQRIRENCSFATDFVVGLTHRGIDVLSTAGMEYRLRTGSFKSCITSKGHGTALFEKRLNPESTFVLSADVDAKKDEYKFGVGFIVSAS